MSFDPAADLVSHARNARVVVIGGGAAGLVAALECAKIGMRVTLLEAGDRLGGSIASAEIDGETVDVAGDGFRLARGALADLIDELGLQGEVVRARPGDTWVAGPHGVAPLPTASMLGIPANPFDDRTRAIIGWSGVWRAYIDRLRPPLTIGTERSLGALVRTRLGARVVDRMVAPLTYGVHGLSPELVDVDSALRGLNTALTRTGSLTGAVSQQLPDAGAPESRATLRGGMSTFVEALRARLVDLDVDIRMAAPVTRIDRIDGGWSVTAAPAGEESDETGPILAHAVIVATPERHARALLAPHLPELDEPSISPDDIDVVTLLLDAPALDARPRGHAVYAVPRPGAASAVVHATATWPHEPGQPHVVRVTLPATDDTDAAAVTAATEAARDLLGVDLGRVRGAIRTRHERGLPASALSPAREAVRATARSDDRLGVVGAWIGGNGLVRVVGDAHTEAERIRSTLLWGTGSEDASR